MKVILKIQTILQKFLQTTNEKLILMVDLDEKPIRS